MNTDNAAEDSRIAELSDYLRSIGLDKLAFEISEERLARRINEAQQIQQQYEFQEHIEHQLQDTLEQRIVAINNTLFDKAAAYNNIVISFGYAGFFAIWNFVSEGMHPWDTALIAILLGSSLQLFIYWTLKVSLHNVYTVKLAAEAMAESYQSSGEKVDAILLAEQNAGEKSIILQGQWFPVFLVTVVTGFGSGILLLTLMFFRVLKIDFSYHDFLLAAWERLLN
ncbi:hypothetical protein [Halocynthiibacter namhaensis]|uniref:hypothetical protein n=1 Tax=Halocynthiibacter namhaensis TaxID=1290553 RepID=UPI00057972DA|nr:hypothetical protein [Halocynthiibacter namhaensis]